MNYTQMYSDIYESLQTTNITHEELHLICVRICNALNDYSMIVTNQPRPIMSAGCKLGYTVTPKAS